MELDIKNKGQEIYNFVKQIYPYFRCLTGEGVRQTLNDIKENLMAHDKNIKFEIKSVPSGTSVFDWNVPKEWKIREAYIEDENGNHIVDIKNNNLHVLGYSTPVDMVVDLEKLKKYIYTQADQPNVIPYVTSYYKERFGFCMSQVEKDNLKPGKYHMYIDSELFDGVLNYGECVINGESDKEIFFSTYVCHPSLANNECSGPAVETEIIKFVSDMKKRKYTYRFIFIPETIGSITYMSTENHLQHMKEKLLAGFNLSCVGDDRAYSIVESRYANTLADKALKSVLKAKTENYVTYPFIKSGSDERQYNAPFIELPIVGFCRTKYGMYPEYHTSADDLSLVTPSGLQGSYEVLTTLINALEVNEYYKVKCLGEPQLGKRGLYPTVSQKGSYDAITSMVNFIKYCDGKNDIFDISERIGVGVTAFFDIVEKLKGNELIGV